MDSEEYFIAAIDSPRLEQLCGRISIVLDQPSTAFNRKFGALLCFYLSNWPRFPTLHSHPYSILGCRVEIINDSDSKLVFQFFKHFLAFHF